MGEDYLADCFLIANKIRKIGVPVEHYLEEKKIKNQLSYAEKKKFRWVLLYGEEEKQKKKSSVIAAHSYPSRRTNAVNQIGVSKTLPPREMSCFPSQ